MTIRSLFALAALTAAGIATSADALTFQCRWVTRSGTTDTVIPDTNGDGVQDLTIAAGQTVRLRLQFGVFDDAMGPAPAGGFVGWNVGTLASTGGTNTRTPGRLTPFNFATGAGSNGSPATDPWTALTGVDNTLGTQSPAWNGLGTPQPPAVVRGRNAFVSTFEVTTMTGSGSAYTITAGGNLIAATEWRVVGTPQEPVDEDGDGVADGPGAVTYAPFPTSPVSFICALNLVPAPGAAALLGLGGLIVGRRRR